MEISADPSVFTGSITRASLFAAGSTTETVATLPTSRPGDVGIDEGNGIVYWSSTNSGTIQLARVTGDQTIETVIDGIVNPTGIAIHDPSIAPTAASREFLRPVQRSYYHRRGA